MSVTVIARATATKLTTLEHVRSDLGQAIGQADDTRIERFIETASARTSSFCRRRFGRETLRERFEIGVGVIDDTTGGLLLECAPVVEIKAVTVDGEPLAADAYEFEGRFLYRRHLDRRRCWYGRVILVEYVAGWFLPSEEGAAPEGVPLLPADVEQAVIQLVGVSVSAASRDPMVKSEDVEGIGSCSFYVQGSSAALPHPEAEATLMQYRRVFLG